MFETLNNTVTYNSNNPLEAGMAIRFLVHFVGDLHQPLHATSRFTVNMPEGDAGGNDFKIVYNSNI